MARKEIGDVAAKRLSAVALAHNFDDVAPALDRRGALIAAQRCYYCYDAPCITACPTGIDIPSFIRSIATDDLKGAAQTILSANILGGMCARVCPTEILCEGDCVRNKDGDRPVEIGALQRHATEWVYPANAQFFERAAPTGKRVAIVGAGPAGLSCAHMLARAGYAITIFDANPKPGGLNEYGIAAYKVPGFAQREIDWLVGIGGIEIVSDAVLGNNLKLADLRRDFSAVFLGIGLGGVNALGLDGESLAGVGNAVDFIAHLRQTPLPEVAVGRRVVVIGGGNTAIDAAIQSKKLGAECVTMVYRRGTESMGATAVEQQFAKSEGVTIIHWAAPRCLYDIDGRLSSIEFEYTQLDDAGRLLGTGDFFTLPADTVLKAIGQVLVPGPLTEAGHQLLDTRGGRIAVNTDYQTSLPGVWAGGDCVGGKLDLTVQSVEDGKRAASAMHRALAG